MPLEWKIQGDRLQGFCSQKELAEQKVKSILSTLPSKYLIYPHDYGFDPYRVVGEPSKVKLATELLMGELRGALEPYGFKVQAVNLNILGSVAKAEVHLLVSGRELLIKEEYNA